MEEQTIALEGDEIQGNKQIEYIVVEMSSAKELAEKVNAAINHGFELQGGVSVTCWFEEWDTDGMREKNTFFLYAQAMTNK